MWAKAANTVYDMILINMFIWLSHKAELQQCIHACVSARVFPKMVWNDQCDHLATDGVSIMFIAWVRLITICVVYVKMFMHQRPHLMIKHGCQDAYWKHIAKYLSLLKNRKVSNWSQIIKKITINIHKIMKKKLKKIDCRKEKRRHAVKMKMFGQRKKTILKHVSFITKIIIYFHIFITLCSLSRAKSGNSKKNIFCTSNDIFFSFLSLQKLFWNEWCFFSSFDGGDTVDATALFSCVQPKNVMNTLLYSEKHFGRLTISIFTRSRTVFFSFAQFILFIYLSAFINFEIVSSIHLQWIENGFSFFMKKKILVSNKRSKLICLRK